MLFVFSLLLLVKATKRICICHNGCSSMCSKDIFDALSSNISFKDYILYQIRNEKEIELNFYSKQKGFVFSIDSSCFNDVHVTINGLSDSQPILLKINQQSSQNYREIEIKPNQKAILSDLIPLPRRITNSKHILDSTETSSIPISVSLIIVDHTGSAQCYNGAKEDSLANFKKNKKSGCKGDISQDQSCGIRCWSKNVNYTYTFKGVKFAIYGTNDDGHGKFDVFLDGNHLSVVNEKTTPRAVNVIVFTSDLLEYREHTVKIAAKGEMYEIYKLVYWPSIKARRFNSTDFQKDDWISETDFIGGVREYKDGNILATISLYCSRFWLYGLNDDNMGDLNIQYHNVTDVVSQYSNVRKEGALLYESPLLDHFKITLTLTSSKTTMINFLYFEEPPIPMSVGILQMDYKDITNCNYYKNKDQNISPDDAKNDKDNKVGCPTNNLDNVNAYQCGLRCWASNAKYSYSFKGVKFAIFGTKDLGHKNFDVKLNGNIIADVSEEGTRINAPELLYESDLLEYSEHAIEIVGKGQTFEIYKIVYWPSLRARRINSTDFIKTDGFTTKSDYIGGIQQSKVNGYAMINVSCSKFWIYGSKSIDVGDVTFYYNGKSETINLYSSTLNESVLIYESPEFEYSKKAISIKAKNSKSLIFNCIYIEETLNPVITPIPISVRLDQMYVNGAIENCGNQNNGEITITTDINDIGCEITNLNSPNSYSCGYRCWGKSMNYKYTFKGVKFGIYGTVTTNFGTIIIELNDIEIARVNQQSDVRATYTQIYESDIYPYSTYTVKIHSVNSGLYELYKLVFWPSMKAKRYNSTDLIKTGNWYSETDGIGGIREYTSAQYGTGTFDKTFSCSRIWLYGSTANWNEGFDLTYDVYSSTITAKTANRVDYELLEESTEMPYHSINLHGQTKGDATISCIYYTYEPMIDEYIDKVFTKCLPYFDILVTSNSIINQISGCKFIQISEYFPYFIKLEKEVLFYDNVFQYDSQQNNPPAPLNISYNGRILIKNCIFENSIKRDNEGGSVFYFRTIYTNQVILQSCEFINCGKSQGQEILKLYNPTSSLLIENCTFKYDNPINSELIDTYSSNIVINNSKFIKAGTIKRYIPSKVLEDIKNLPDSFSFSITGNFFDSTEIFSDSQTACLYIDFTKPTTLIFEDNIISNIKNTIYNSNLVLIDANNQIEQIEFRNISFIDNACACTLGGGSGVVFRQVPYIIFTECHFKNNEARRIGTPVIKDYEIYNGDGGGIQLGLYCDSNEAAIKFDHCEFKDNKAQKHGGAISIQTLSTVEISNCIFDSNHANYNFRSSANLLFENHFHKKQQGRAGAIYINPTYTYNGPTGSPCFDPNKYMTNVSIIDCQFVSNSAYDGYAIYIEGDDAGTEFIVERNNFTNNFKSDLVDDNDVNISIRGVIATEIHSFPENIKSKNTFNYDLQRIKPLKLVFVDHYGNRIPTFVFTESQDFSYSQAFSYSHEFSYSNDFSNSVDFTKSDLFSFSVAFTKSSKFTDSDFFPSTSCFSNSEKFTESDGFSGSQLFSYSDKFTYSNIFTDSKDFTYSKEFSKSRPFSGTTGFTKTEGFTETGEFSLSQKFTLSDKFSESKDFTCSKEFSKSQPFSGTTGFTKTEGFTETGEFSLSTKFTLSDKFSESKDFTYSKEFSKSQPFSGTTGFTKTEGFTETGEFSLSTKFTLSDKFSESKDFTYSQEFSKSQPFSGTTGFTKTEGFTETGEFSLSTKFTLSNKFSDSKDFSYSSKFSNSNKFSESHEFSKTGEFSETEGFSKTKQFSESHEFTNSLGFSKSQPFSTSKTFSLSGGFSYSDKFTNTEDFSLTTHFTESTAFTKSKNFSPSSIFSNSLQFSNSYYFSKSKQFSYSEHFTESHPYSESDIFTMSFSFTPPFIEDPSCIIMKNDENITLDRCSYFGDNDEEDVLVRIIKTNFTSFVNESNGGAILIGNCGFECIDVNYTECISVNGGGGAIYIKNSRTLKYNITIINTWFTRCKAVFGGACYIYSSSESNDVLFELCKFRNNSLNNKNLNGNNNEIFGGSSLFISARNGNMSHCLFIGNKGSSGCVKMYNKFDDENKIKTLEKENKKMNSFSISNCEFENDNNEESKGMILLINKNDLGDFEINDCKFKGKLAKGYHYIDGMLHEKDKPKLQIKSCQFDFEDKDSVNIELFNDFTQNEINLPLSSHLIGFNGKNALKIIIYFVILSSFVFSTFLFFKRVDINDKNKDDDILEQNFNELKLQVATIKKSKTTIKKRKPSISLNFFE